MSDRRAFQASQDRVDRIIARERRLFARGAVKAIMRAGHDREQYDGLAHAMAMAEIDRNLNRFYGRFPGDQAGRLWQIITQEAVAIWRDRFRRVFKIRRGKT